MKLSAAQCEASHHLLKHCLDKLHILHSDCMTFGGNAKVTSKRAMLDLTGKQAASEGYVNIQVQQVCRQYSGASTVPKNPSSFPSMKARKLPPVASRYCPSLQQAVKSNVLGVVLKEV